MDLYHLTTPEAATNILRQGFRDSTGSYLTNNEYSGVWLTDSPDSLYQMGLRGNTLLKINFRLPESELAAYEWIEEGKGYREWLAPAVLVNANSSIEIIDVDEPPDWAT